MNSLSDHFTGIVRQKLDSEFEDEFTTSVPTEDEIRLMGVRTRDCIK